MARRSTGAESGRTPSTDRDGVAARGRPLRVRRRGATITEYALILLGVLLLAAGGFRLLGPSLGKRATQSGAELEGTGGGAGGSSSGGSQGGGGGGGAIASSSGGAGAGGGGGGGGSSGEKLSAAEKVEVGGVGGAGAAGPGDNGAGGGATGANPGGPAGTAGSGDGAPVDADSIDGSITFRRGFGIALLAAGVLALGFVFAKGRNVKKEADAQGGGPDEPPLV